MIVSGRPARIVECSAENGYLLPLAKTKLAQLWERYDAFKGAAPLQQISAGPHGEEIEVSIVNDTGRIRIHGGGATPGAPFYYTTALTFRTVDNVTTQYHLFTVYDFNHVVVREHLVPVLAAGYNSLNLFISTDASSVLVSRFEQSTGRQFITVARGTVAAELILDFPVNNRIFVTANADGTRFLYQRSSNISPLLTIYGVIDVAYTEILDDQGNVIGYTGVITDRTVAENLLTFGYEGTSGTYDAAQIVCIDPTFTYLYGYAQNQAGDVHALPFRSWDSVFDIFRIDMNTGAMSIYLSLPSLEPDVPSEGTNSNNADYDFSNVFITPAADGSAWVWIIKVTTASSPNGVQTTTYTPQLFHGGQLIATFTESLHVGINGNQQLSLSFPGTGFHSAYQGRLSGHTLPHFLSDDGASFFMWYASWVSSTITGALVSWNRFSLMDAIGGDLPIDHFQDVASVPVGSQTNGETQSQTWNASPDGGSDLQFLTFESQVIGAGRSLIDSRDMTARLSVKINDVEVSSSQINNKWLDFSATFQSSTEVGSTFVIVGTATATVPNYEGHRLTIESDGLPFLLSDVRFSPEVSLDGTTATVRDGNFLLDGNLFGQGPHLSSWGKYAVCPLTNQYLDAIGATVPAPNVTAGYGTKFIQSVQLPAGSCTLILKARTHPNFIPGNMGNQTAYPLFGSRVEKKEVKSNRNRIFWKRGGAYGDTTRPRFYIFEKVLVNGRYEIRLAEVSAEMPAGTLPAGFAPDGYLHFFDTRLFQ
jgi:hypothetical protein